MFVGMSMDTSYKYIGLGTPYTYEPNRGEKSEMKIYYKQNIVAFVWLMRMKESCTHFIQTQLFFSFFHSIRAVGLGTKECVCVRSASRFLFAALSIDFLQIIYT